MAAGAHLVKEKYEDRLSQVVESQPGAGYGNQKPMLVFPEFLFLIFHRPIFG